MAALKYSRQRESIKEYLANTSEHPTADIVYMHVKEEYPNISLGTVYRNLNLLAELGEAKKITTPDGADRFDGHTTPHYHFCCTCCGKVKDIYVEDMDYIGEFAGKHFDGVIESHTAMFFGKCKDCAQKE